MKNVICKEFKYGEFYPYQVELLSENEEGFFLPVSFQIMGEGEKKSLLACYDISRKNPLTIIYDGAEAPYIASKLIDSMIDSMDKYLMPMDYLMEKSFLYTDSRGRIQAIFVPSCEGRKTEDGESNSIERTYSGVGMEIRNKIAVLIREIYPQEGVAFYDILERTIEVLEDKDFGFDGCRRRIELIKEESVKRRMERSFDSIDLSGSFV